MGPDDIPSSPDALEDRHVIECGCVFGSYKGNMAMFPCGPTCEMYQFALAEAARKSKPIVLSSDY